MRISDWSSDVCSSDLQRLQDSSIVDEQTVLLLLMQPVHTGDGLDQIMLFELLVDVKDSIARLFRIAARGSVSFAMFLIWRKWSSENSSSRHCAQNFRGVLVRSEEHTSELQSLMSIP